VTILDVARRIIERTGSPSAVTFVPYREAYGERFEDMERRAADPSRMEAAIGFRCATTLDEILDSVIAERRERPTGESTAPSDLRPPPPEGEG
jgi:UDP-glucose 4-epimerase